MNAPDRPLVVLAAISVLQGAALIAYAVFDVVEAVRVGLTGPAEVSNPPALILLVVITALLGAAMVWVARGWWRARSWARSPFVLAQILAALVGYELAQSAGQTERVVGIVVVLVAALGLVLSFSPAVSRAFTDQT